LVERPPIPNGRTSPERQQRDHGVPRRVQERELRQRLEAFEHLRLGTYQTASAEGVSGRSSGTGRSALRRDAPALVRDDAFRDRDAAEAEVEAERRARRRSSRIDVSLSCFAMCTSRR